MFLVAYDPETDFTIEPWLESTIGRGLKLGEAVGGTYVFVPEGEQNIKIYGYFVTLKGNMEPTGTGLDQSMFTYQASSQTGSGVPEDPAEASQGLRDSHDAALLLAAAQAR